MKQEIVEIALKEITPLENTRSFIDKEELKELAASIKKDGLKQAILVRKNGKGYQLIFGRRRFEAHKLLKMDKIKAVVEQHSDEDVLRLQIVENLQRTDLTPQDEMIAIGNYYNKQKVTIKAISEWLGKSMQYVHLRIKGSQANKELKGLFMKNEIRPEVFFTVAKYPESVQARVVKENPHILRWSNMKDIDEELQENTYSLKKAPFKLDDDKFKAGACIKCPKRSSVATELFPDLTKADTCLDHNCFAAKSLEHTYSIIDAMYKTGKEFVFVKEYYGPPISLAKYKDAIVLEPDKFTKSKKGIPAIVVGPMERLGKVIKINLVKAKAVKQPEDAKVEKVDTKQELKDAKSRIQNRYNIAIYRAFSAHIKTLIKETYEFKWDVKKFIKFGELDNVRNAMFDFIIEMKEQYKIKEFLGTDIPMYFDADSKEGKAFMEIDDEALIKLFVMSSMVRHYSPAEDYLGSLRSNENPLADIEKLAIQLEADAKVLKQRRENIVKQIAEDFEKPLKNHNLKWKDKTTMKDLFDNLQKERDNSY